MAKASKKITAKAETKAPEVPAEAIEQPVVSPPAEVPEPPKSPLELRAEMIARVVLSHSGKALRESFKMKYAESKGDLAMARSAMTVSGEPNMLSPKQIRDVKLADEVAVLSGDHEPLMAFFHKEADINSISDIALKFDKPKLVETLTQAGVPEEFKREDGTPDPDAYARKIADGLFRMQPMSVMHGMINREELKIADVNLREGVKKVLDSVHKFNLELLKEGEETAVVDLRKMSVYDFLAHPNVRNLVPDEHKEGVTSEFKTMQRVANIAHTAELMPKIVETGLTSAHLITNMPLQTFVRKYQETLGGEDAAKTVYRNAENIAIRNEHYLMAMREAVSGSGVRIIDEMHSEETVPMPYATRSDSIEDSAIANAMELARAYARKGIRNAPPATYGLLFGNVDLCECDECNSVYSAAAYYVELLQYLRNNNLDKDNANTGQKGIENTPLEKLFRRRPDLGNLQLTCRNTNTLLPYIDLVNEVMESFVVYHEGRKAGTIDPNQPIIAAHDVEEDDTSSQLLSEPANTNYDAYCILKKKVFPFTLPYHQPIDEARIFLDYLGTSRYELLKYFRSVMPPMAAVAGTGEKPKKGSKKLRRAYKEMLNRAADAECLGLTEEEYVILTKQGFSTKEKWELETETQRTEDDYLAKICHKKVWQYYGFKDESDMVPELKMVKPVPDDPKMGFLKRTGLLYVDLVELLKTRFINPNVLNGEALEYFKRIRYSYGFLDSKVNKKIIDPKKREKRYPDVIGLLIGQKNKDYPDKYPDSFIEQWVCKYFDRVGKLIVLENGAKCSCNIGSFSFEYNKSDGSQGGISAITDEKCYILRLDGGEGPDWLVRERLGYIGTDGKIILDNGKLSGVTITGGEFNILKDGVSESVKFSGDTIPNLCEADNCDITKVRLQHLDGTDLDEPYENGEPYQDYDRMHRFIRLWRKLGWTIDEVDKAIMGLGGVDEKTEPTVGGKTKPEKDCDDCHDPDKPGENDCIPDKGDGKHYDITPELLHQLAAVKKLAGITGLELAKLLTFWTDISTLGEKSLYKRLFLTHNMLGLDKVFKDDDFGNYLTKPEKERIIKDHLPILMAALRLKSENIESILAHVGLTSAAPLTLANVSLLYRYSLLAKVLGARIDDMLEAMDLLKPVAEPFTDARSTVKFFEAYQKIEDSGMKPELLHYIVNNVENPRKPHAPQDKTIYNLAKSLRDALLKIETEHADITDTTEVTDELIRAKTSLHFSGEVVEKIIGLLDGTTVYADNTRRKYTQVHIDLAQNLTQDNIDTIVEFLKTQRKTNEGNPDWANFYNRVQYDAARGLQIKGILPDSDISKVNKLVKLLAELPDRDKRRANFEIAVRKMLKQPDQFFTQELLEIFKDSAAAKTALLSPDTVSTQPPSPGTSVDKRTYFLKAFLPYLREKLQEQVIIQQVAGAMGIDEKMARLLLKEVIIGQHDGQKVYDDLLQLKKQPEVDPKTSSCDPAVRIGYLIPAADGDYTFQIESEDEVKFSIDGKPVWDKREADDEGIITFTSAVLSLQAGHAYPFAISGFEQDAGGNIAYFSWKKNEEKFAPVPANALFPNLHTDDFRQDYIRLQKAVWVIRGLNLSADEVKYLVKYAVDFDQLNFNTLLTKPEKAFSLKQWLRLYEYAHLRDGLLQKSFTLLDFFRWVKEPKSIPLEDQLAKLLLRKKEEIHKLISAEHFNLLQYEDFYHVKNLRKLKETLDVADKSGADLEMLFDWAKPASKFIITRRIAEGIRNATRARYAQDEWEEAVKPLSDKLRTNQKQALIAYLLVQQPLINWGVVDADSLFEFFLIDVQMEACMQTSRIKQAISSVQLFVQRCFLNLEAPYGIDNTMLNRDRWDWMQRYRVWEANRKVFLYPENWIEANLRDDKSPFFKELESELLQKDISKDNVTDALKAYLYKVDEVANMEVVGLYIDGTKKTDGTWNKGNKLHVFSRTRNAPYFFFYRYLALDEMNWYPWEKMQVDIPSYDVEDTNEKIVNIIDDAEFGKVKTVHPNPDFGKTIGNGCYLTPVVWNGRLLIFFPQFMKKTRSPQIGNTTFKDMANNPPDANKPIEYWEIKLAWSEYQNGKWTQKQVGKDALYHPDTTAYNSIYDTALRAAAAAAAAADATDADKSEMDKVVEKKYQAYKQAIVARNAADVPPFDHTDVNSERSAKFNFAVSEMDAAFNEWESAKKVAIAADKASMDARKKANTAAQTLSTLLPPVLLISNYEFVPATSPDLTKISIYYDSTVVGVFEFEGTRLYTNDQISPEPNSIEVNWFHHLSGVYNKIIPITTIKSLQVVGPEIWDYQFEDLHHSTIISSGDFYYKYTRDLLGLLNQSQLKNLFQFNLEKISDPIYSFGFGDHDQYPKTAEIYHELKKPYSLYNWELFFHTPTMLADALSKSQQFEEAMKWYHYVFNPQVEGTESTRFWRFFPFQQTNAQNVLERIFSNLKPNKPDKDISEWRNKPFRPHVVARNRPVAYMKYVVMKYLDNLIDWGDYLFRQDTIESINQATQLYILAGHILGPRPQFIPKRGKITPSTYNDLLDKWDAFGNAMSELEILVPYSIQIDSADVSVDGQVYHGNIFGFGTSLYFCIPGNPKLLGYWKTVEDRLYKIRHCENIEGVFRMLPLFEPPIDPALLVAAAAQGISIDSVLADVNTPMPNYRFNYLLQKALELCGELKSLSNALVSAREKKDNEALSLLRAKHESHLQDLIMEVKKQQLEEAQKNIEGLQFNRKSPEYKLRHYQQLIGAELSDIAEDADFQEIANNMPALVDESGYKLIPSEKEEMNKSNEAQQWQRGIGIVETLASILHVIPSFNTDAKPFGIGMSSTITSGWMLGNAAQAVAKGLQVHASDLSFASTNAGKKTGFLRQLQDRVFQANLAGHEIKQLDKQITTQKIREHIANLEISNHQQVIDNAREIEDFLRNKYSNEELYQWMDGQIKTVYRQVYNLAFELAKKAEKVYRFEKGLTSSNFIQAGYWDAGRDGLMSGERLYLALKQMESAYAEDRGHDYEITKDVSLRQLDPIALIELKEKGSCEFEIPETLFDMDYAGHYKRRIKSVSVTIPCVVGPYSSLNCTLRLLKHEYRNDKLAKTGADYLQKTEETDERFVSDRVPITAIAVSQGQNDSGVFELNFKDERFMPFEGAGAISSWRLELPNDFRQFDYDTISDVVLQMRYTSCEGGGGLKKAALQNLTKYVQSAEELSRREGLFRMASLRHEFSTEWYRFMHPGGGPQVMDLGNLYDRLPFFTKSKSVTGVKMNAFIVVAPLGELTIKLCGPKDPVTGIRAISHDITSPKDLGTLKSYANMELSDDLRGTEWFLEISKPGGAALTAAELTDVFIVIRYNLNL